MKKQKTLKILCILSLLFVLSAGLSSATEHLDTIEYQEKEFIVVQGDPTFVFNRSEHNDNNDLNIIKLFYENTTNLSVFLVESLEISYDYSFINDTKTYFFNNDTYSISVDYSSINVPWSPIDELREEIELLNKTIHNLTKQLENETENTTTYQNLTLSLLQQMETKNQTIENLTTYVEEKAKPLSINYTKLQSKYNSVNQENTRLNQEIITLEERIANKDATIKGLEGIFSMTYPKGDITLLNINLAWFLIGGVAFILIYFFLGSPEKVQTLFKKTKSLPFLKKPEKTIEEPRTPSSIEHFAEKEESLLKPGKESKEVYREISNEVDSLLYG